MKFIVIPLVVLLSIEAPALPVSAQEQQHNQISSVQKIMHHYVNWTKSTGGTYPNMSRYKNVWLNVSIPQQRMYVMSHQTHIYTMIISTGIDASPSTYTPRGTFYIQPERGDWFYNPRFSMGGAEYWISFLGHGVYLFHTVPMDRSRNVIPTIARTLGHESSHGCIHLSLPDAKWLYDNIETGTKLVIHD